MENNNYFKITQFLNITLLSIFLGIISSIMINIVTGFNFEIYTTIIVIANLIAVIAVIKLILIRQSFDEDVYARAKIQEPDKDKWGNSIGIKKKKQFYCWFSIASITFLVSVIFIFIENRHLQSQNKQKELINQNLITNTDRLNNLVYDSLRKVILIQKLTDSLLKMKTE